MWFRCQGNLLLTTTQFKNYNKIKIPYTTYNYKYRLIRLQRYVIHVKSCKSKSVKPFSCKDLIEMLNVKK